jgi:hypothetical protein
LPLKIENTQNSEMVLTRRQAQQADHARINGTRNCDDGVQQVEAAVAPKQNGNREIKTPVWVWVLLAVFAAVTLATVPEPFHPPHGEAPSIRHVFYYGWLTAISTGLGALPFLLFPDVATYWVGISNGTLVEGILGFAR